MKVVYNACYGGFGLSHEAMLAYGKKKGVDLVAYGIKYEDGTTGYSRCSDGRVTYYTTKDVGDVPTFSDISTGLFKFPEGFRHDPDLVAVVEDLGSEASSGDHARLRIIEIPDGAEYEIDEYDGHESILPPRQSWDEV